MNCVIIVAWNKQPQDPVKLGLFKPKVSLIPNSISIRSKLGWTFHHFAIVLRYKKMNVVVVFFCFNWDSLHARLNSQYEAWSYKKKSTKKITAYRKSV